MDVELEADGDLAVITVNRPHRRNAIGPDTMDALDKALDAATDATALVVTGAGDRAFVSGGDLKELAAIRSLEDARTMALRMHGICERLVAFPGPVIAALNGSAFGGGAEFATAADIRIAAHDIKIGFTQTALAIVPAWGGAERLAKLIGPGKALLLAGAATVLDAEQAERIGLIDHVLPRPEFEQGWRTIARSLATAQAREIKRLVTRHPTPEDAAEAFAHFWVAQEHWDAAERTTRGR
ncbi:MAG TPA: enoyl-CoA hydratase/isomerase family protein [Actinospica sp.]|jgi:enoyl-CoA hydratase/carnithine racemase|nr:enoyl-CoA hydratase/isomerase family protein [Actinospica sp.]